MNNSTIESSAPAAPAASIPTGVGLNELSKEAFELLIQNGGTINIRQLNNRLKLVKVDAASLNALGVTVRQNRGAVHMAAAEFRSLCEKLHEHFFELKDAQNHP